MTLAKLYELYVISHPLSAGAMYLLRRTLDILSRDLDHAATIDDLRGNEISLWIEKLAERYKPETVAGHRTRIITLWLFAHEIEMCARPPRIRRVHLPPPMPRTWSNQELRRLLRAASAHRESIYFLALIRVAYETGLRRSDLWRLTRDELRGQSFRISKTGAATRIHLTPHTARQIAALPGDVPLRPPWGQRGFYRRWKLIVETAQVSRGALHQIRRTGATLIARRDGIERAKEYLGHADDRSWRRYVDTTAARPKPRPPKLA